jgi:hypothetical protein
MHALQNAKGGGVAKTYRAFRAYRAPAAACRRYRIGAWANAAARRNSLPWVAYVQPSSLNHKRDASRSGHARLTELLGEFVDKL